MPDSSYLKLRRPDPYLSEWGDSKNLDIKTARIESQVKYEHS